MALVVEVKQCLVEGLHPQLTAFVHHRLDRTGLPLGEQIGDGRRVQQDLDGCLALAVERADQALRDDALEVGGKVHHHLRLALVGEKVHHPVERLIGVVGV